ASRPTITSKQVAAAIIGVVVVALSVWFAASRRGNDAVRTIAVVPVIVGGVDSTQQYVSDGIADDITSALLQVRTLSVINRSSANAFKAKAIDTRAAAKALGVDHVLE